MIRFAIITDPHCTSDTEASSRSDHTDPNARFSATIEWLARRNDALDFVVFTGDLVNEPGEESYRTFLCTTERLTSPRYFLPGNHDLREPFRQHLLGQTSSAPICYEFFHPDPTRPRPDESSDQRVSTDLRGLVLDTLVEGEIGGAVPASQLEWVRARINEDPGQPTVVFMHHPPLPTGIDWIDAEPTENGGALIEVLARGNVLAVFFGHVHMEMGLTARGIPCLGTPATTRQFTDGLDREKTEWDRPGLRLVTIDGACLSSYVDRIPDSSRN